MIYDAASEEAKRLALRLSRAKSLREKIVEIELALRIAYDHGALAESRKAMQAVNALRVDG